MEGTCLKITRPTSAPPRDSYAIAESEVTSNKQKVILKTVSKTILKKNFRHKNSETQVEESGPLSTWNLHFQMGKVNKQLVKL